MDVRSTSVRISVHGTARREARRLTILELWPQARCSRQVHEPQGLAILVFQDMMRRSIPRIVRTTLNHALACVCFRSAARFRKAERIPPSL